MTQARGVTCDVLFTVNEGPNGCAWISLEPRKPVPEMEKLHLAFDLPADIDLDRASGIARYLNATLGSLRLTFLEGVEVR